MGGYDLGYMGHQQEGVGAGRGMSGPWRAHEQVHEIPRRRVTAGDI